jgi:hypothetical protein
MTKAYIINKKDLSYGIYYTLDTLFKEINNKDIKPNDFYFFTNEDKALECQEQLINKQRRKNGRHK